MNSSDAIDTTRETVATSSACNYEVKEVSFHSTWNQSNRMSSASSKEANIVNLKKSLCTSPHSSSSLSFPTPKRTNNMFTSFNIKETEEFLQESVKQHCPWYSEEEVSRIFYKNLAMESANSILGVERIMGDDDWMQHNQPLGSVIHPDATPHQQASNVNPEEKSAGLQSQHPYCLKKRDSTRRRDSAHGSLTLLTVPMSGQKTDLVGTNASDAPVMRVKTGTSTATCKATSRLSSKRDSSISLASTDNDEDNCNNVGHQTHNTHTTYFVI
eukprot:m.23252 g.23252  ORF g.23252 m.23252 type:complete len:271 (+) comp8958_c0_seq2:247-1059(+)